MRLRTAFVMVCALLVAGGLGAWWWLARERARLSNPRVSFDRGPKSRLLHVRDSDGRGELVAYSLFGDGRFVVSTYLEDRSRPVPLGEEPRRRGRDKPRLVERRHGRLPSAEVESIWNGAVAAGLLEYDANVLSYRIRRYGYRARKSDPIWSHAPRPSIQVTMNSGSRDRTFDAVSCREMADLYPEIPTFAGCAELLERLQRLPERADRTVPRAADSPPSTAAVETSLR